MRRAGHRTAAAGLLAGGLLLAGCLLLTGCLMPNRGTPVYVDSWAGESWSGKGLLLEVSPDQKRCLVAIRDRALVVRERWIDCTSVHPRRGR